MSVHKNIEIKLAESLQPSHLEVMNESDRHSVAPGSESHFKVVVVSGQFEGVGQVERHRAVHQCLKNEFAQGLHALSLQTFTPREWEKRNQKVEESPPCLGGDKGENSRVKS